MAARLTDKQKKGIFADRVDGMSLGQLSKKYGVSKTTIHRTLKSDPETERKVTEKKEQNTADILAYMESKRDKVCEIIGIGLDTLPEKIRNAKTASDVTTALGTVIDKWAMISGGPQDEVAEDGLSRSLRELAEGMESDGDRT